MISCPHCGKPAGQNDLRPAGEMICHHCGEEWLTDECAARYADYAAKDWDERLSAHQSELTILRTLQDAAIAYATDTWPSWRDRGFGNPIWEAFAEALYQAEKRAEA